MYTYVPSSSPAPTPSLPPVTTTYTSIPSAFVHKPAGTMAPPPSSARFVHGGYGYANANTNTTPSRARGPSFASTTSYASSSTAYSTFSAGSSATSHSTASAVSPITPRSGYVLTSPTRTFKPYWEREITSLENEEGLRLDEAEEGKIEGEGNNEIEDEDENENEDEDEEFAYSGYGVDGSSSSTDYTRYMSYIAPSPLPSLAPSSPISTIDQRKGRPRRSPFADNDPRAPNSYAHVYLNDELYPARRSASLSSNRETRARRSESPRSLRSVTISRHASGSSVRGRSPAQRSPSVSSHSQDHEHSLSFELGLNSSLDTRPDLGLDASPLRAALLLNPDSDAFEASSVSVQAERRFSGRGFGLGLGGMGLGLGGDEVSAGFDGGGLKDEVQRRRAEWTEFDGDAFSSSSNSPSMDSPSGRHSPMTTVAAGFSPGHLNSSSFCQPPIQTLEVDAVDLGSWYDLTSARPCSRSQMRGGSLDCGAEVNLASPRPSLSRTCSGQEMSSFNARPASGVFNRLLPRGTSYVNTEKVDSGRQVDGVENEDVEKNKEDDEENEATKCLEVRWQMRARWASLKLRLRLGAFRARRRVGLA